MYITLANQERSVVQSQSLFFNGKEFFLPYQSMHYFHTILDTASISHTKMVFTARFLWRIERCAEPISKVESHILAGRPDSCASLHEKLSNIRLAPSRYLCVFGIVNGLRLEWGARELMGRVSARLYNLTPIFSHPKNT